MLPLRGELQISWVVFYGGSNGAGLWVPQLWDVGTRPARSSRVSLPGPLHPQHNPAELFPPAVSFVTRGTPGLLNLTAVEVNQCNYWQMNLLPSSEHGCDEREVTPGALAKRGLVLWQGGEGNWACSNQGDWASWEEGKRQLKTWAPLGIICIVSLSTWRRGCCLESLGAQRVPDLLQAPRAESVGRKLTPCQPLALTFLVFGGFTCFLRLFLFF